MITSTSNNRVKYVRALQNQAQERRASGEFVIEGIRLAEEAAGSGWPASLVFYTEDLNQRGRAVLPRLAAAGAQLEVVAPHVMKAASDTQNPQGLLVVLGKQDLELPANLDFALILDQLHDPGNLGSILRTAAAAGVGAVLLPPGTADPLAPKVLRAAMGAHFHLPVHTLAWPDLGKICTKHQLQIFLADAAAALAYTQADYRTPTAILIGSEAQGAGPQALQLPHTGVHIPMQPGNESLNAAAAAAVLIYETVRQRGMRQPPSGR
jgi:TrmH family RNA methyltransferase